MLELPLGTRNESMRNPKPAATSKVEMASDWTEISGQALWWPNPSRSANGAAIPAAGILFA